MSKHFMQDSLFQHAYTVCAADLNLYGIIHGGRLLTLCDNAGYVSAHRHANYACLTRAVHRAEFHRGAEEDEELVISARVGLTGKSSIWVPVNIISAHSKKPVIDAVFVYVAVDHHKKVQTVSPVIACSDEEKQIQKMLEQLRNQINEPARARQYS